MKRTRIIIVCICIVFFCWIYPISVKAATSSHSNDASTIATAKMVYLDKSFKVPASTRYYKINLGKTKLAIIEIKTDRKITHKQLNNGEYSFNLFYLSKGELKSADCIHRNNGKNPYYLLDKNKEYYLECSATKELSITLHNKTKDSIKLSKKNKGKITSLNYERLYRFKTTQKNNETVLAIKYAGEGARLEWYLVGLDKKGNVLLETNPGVEQYGEMAKYDYHNTLDKNKTYYVFLNTDKFVIPTKFTLNYYSGQTTKYINNTKYNKKYSGSTFGYSDQYTFDEGSGARPMSKFKIKVQIKGKNIVAIIDDKKIICKKGITKTMWVFPYHNMSNGLSVEVYQKGKRGKYNLAGNNYSIRITKLK